MTDIVERLRALVIMDEVGSDNPLGREAADEIERLHRRVVALERMISEEIDAWETSDPVNQMLIETAHEANARRAQESKP